MFSCLTRFFILAVVLNISLANAFEDSAFSTAEASATSYYNYDDNKCIVKSPEPAQPPSPPKPKSSKELQNDFYTGNLQFTAKFLYNVVNDNPGKSVTLSPFSTLFLLAELALYATGETARQLLNALNFENKDEIRTEIPLVLDSIAEQNNVTLKLAERVYGNIKNEFSDSFKKDTKDIFKAQAENIDFEDPQKAADIINKWISDNTNGKITDLVPASALKPNTELVLANALYFDGVWRYQFNPSNTSPKKFYVSDKDTIIVQTMNQVKFFRYAQSNELDAQAIELPYVNDNLTCLILLPNTKDGATILVTKLLDSNSLIAVRNSLESTRVDLSLPKFNTSTRTDLKNTLQKLNITYIFDPNSSGLSGILDVPRNLFVSAGFQQATIEINESGSIAAAANAIIVATAAAIYEPPIEFNADHPFVYYLLYNGTPFFCGLFAGN